MITRRYDSHVVNRTKTNWTRFKIKVRHGEEGTRQVECHHKKGEMKEGLGVPLDINKEMILDINALIKLLIA